MHRLGGKRLTAQHVDDRAAHVHGQRGRQGRQHPTMAPVGIAAATTTPVGTSLQYNTTTRHYLYPWKTRIAWANTCRQFDLEFNDGSEHVADFQFTT